MVINPLVIFLIFLQNCTGELGPCAYRKSRKRDLYIPSENSYNEQCIVQGDIVCETSNIINRHGDVDIEDGPFMEGDIIPSRTQVVYKSIAIVKWPNGTVPFVFHKSIDRNGKILIVKAMNQFHKVTCIRFTKRKNETDYLMIGSNFLHVCASHIGRQGGKQTLHLGPNCYKKVGTTMHELMHALGFYHEHMRPDRDKFVYINYSNIDVKLWKNFMELNPGIIYAPNAGYYDFGSIMHYNLCAMTNNTWPTIVPKVTTAESEIGQRNDFSLWDVIKINNFYNCGRRRYSPPLNIADFVNSSTSKFYSPNLILPVIVYTLHIQMY